VRDRSQAKGGRKEILYCRRRPMIPKTGGGGSAHKIHTIAQHTTANYSKPINSNETPFRSRGGDPKKVFFFTWLVGCWIPRLC